uniref:Uncharacterized protein n=1 Tax=Caenorhabditis japonica TaxID=281687 RepID=A0A8R1I7P5_CAEJA
MFPQKNVLELLLDQKSEFTEPTSIQQQIFSNPALHFIYENVHLFRDPTGVFPPRILMVRAGKHNSKYYLTVLPINSTEIFTDGSETRLEFFDKRTPNPDSRQKAEFIYRKTELKFTLFDTSNRIFYMDHSTPISYRVEKFYLYDDSQGQTKVIQLENYYNASSETVKRFDWIEDQYAQKFYYKEEVENVTTLFEVPMGIDLIPYLNGARAGTKIGELSAPGKTENAFDGAFFTLETRQPVSGMTAHFSRLDSEDQMSCDMEPVDSKFAILNKLFIIR